MVVCLGKHSVAAAFLEERCASVLVCGRTQKGSSQKELVQRHASAAGDSDREQRTLPIRRSEAARLPPQPDEPAPVPIPHKTGKNIRKSTAAKKVAISIFYYGVSVE